MIEYKASSDESLISVIDDMSFMNNLKNRSISLSIESNSPSPLGSSQSSLSSIQLHSHEWPAFQESYNSIMDSTNLVDSCAAALCDISAKDDRSAILTPEKELWTYNHSLSFERSSVQNMSVKNDQAKGFDDETTQTDPNLANKMAQFSIWLNRMEEFVEAQPKLSKIFAMDSKQMITQKVIHSKLFREITAQTCIVKGFKQHEYKLIEERYHLLYLKVYEVLILLEGLPKVEGFEASMSDEIDAAHNLNDHIDNDDNNIINSLDSNENNNEANSSLTNIGFYHFKYMEPESKQMEQSTHDNGMLDKMSSTINERCDKEFTFDSDLHSLLDSTDANHSQTSENYSVQHSDPILLQHQTTNETVIEVQDNAQDDFSELLQQQTLQEQNISNNHHKVYDWLLTNTETMNRSKSSMSLKSTCDHDIRSLYRRQSSMALKVSRSSSSFRALANEEFPGIEHLSEQSINSSCGTTENNKSLIWDNFQSNDCASKSETNVNSITDTSEMAELMNNVCYFGDDYSQHFRIENSSSFASSIELNSTTTNSIEFLTSHETALSKNVLRPKRRQRRKRPIVKHINTETSSLCSEASVSNISTASTLPAPPAINASIDEFGEKITYNSDDKSFEVHGNDTIEPKKIKVGQMRPEDFYDIVKMCQNNIDCVITVLGAEPNRILTVSYCQQMKYERNQNEPSRTYTCKCDSSGNENKSLSGILFTKVAKESGGYCKCLIENIKQSTCICAWVSHTIAMILNFLFDCWNVFRNMKLYTYLGRVIKAFFNSAKYVTDHFNLERKSLHNKQTKYL